jgi:hypothetical protein
MNHEGGEDGNRKLYIGVKIYYIFLFNKIYYFFNLSIIIFDNINLHQTLLY